MSAVVLHDVVLAIMQQHAGDIPLARLSTVICQQCAGSMRHVSSEYGRGIKGIVSLLYNITHLYTHTSEYSNKHNRHKTIDRDRIL